MFFSEEIRLNLPNADISYFPNFFSKTEAEAFYNLVLNETNWQQDTITVFGKTHKQPRLTALLATIINNTAILTLQCILKLFLMFY